MAMHHLNINKLQPLGWLGQKKEVGEGGVGEGEPGEEKIHLPTLIVYLETL